MIPMHFARIPRSIAMVAVLTYPEWRTGDSRRHVFDIPPAALFCNEHRSERKRCICGAVTTAALRAEATARARYGPALRAYVCYLANRQHVPIAWVAELWPGAIGAPVLTGAILVTVQEGSTMREGSLGKVKRLFSRYKGVKCSTSDTAPCRRHAPKGAVPHPADAGCILWGARVGEQEAAPRRRLPATRLSFD